MSARMGAVLDALPYVPFPEEYKFSIQSGLEQKFQKEAIRSDHEFTAKNKDGRVKVNYAAFTDSLHCDLDTAAVTIYYDPEDQFSNQNILTQLAFTGAPFILVGRKDQIQPFGFRVNGRPEPVSLGEGYSYRNIREFFARYQSDINPGRILAVKNGTSIFEAFSQLNSFQLRLFALDVTRSLLAETFGEAVSLLREVIGNRGDDQLVVDFAVRLLGAIILAHKGRLGEDLTRSDVSFDRIYLAAAQRFPAYFKRDIGEQYIHAVRAAYSRLQQATYSSFTPDMLSELYTRAYPDREMRKREGRYDTPLYLTRIILKNLPLETLRPETRLLLDMTCGWGSFLVAGYERLSQMNDMGGLVLSQHIIGNDYDRFTSQLARVALLTTSLNDDWRVEDQDALHLDLHGQKPTIIVGNPKFRGAREAGKQATEIDPSTGESKRLQEADKFLIQAINVLEPGGYLGMLMPKSFSVGEASTNSRRVLLETCDIQEIWDLPDQVFKGQATVRPMVIFAQKRSETGRLLNFPVRSRSAQGKSLEEKGVFAGSGIAPSQSTWGETSTKARYSGAKVTHLISYTNILSENAWKEIFNRCRKIRDVTEILPGAKIGNPDKRRRSSPSKFVPWLTNARVTLPRPFFIKYGSKTVLYPDGLEEPRVDKEEILRGFKVLLAADIDPSWGQRAKVAIERRGFYASGSFWILVPKSGTYKLEVLAAILSWDVSNAWIVENARYPWIQRRTLENIPVPHLSEEENRIIVETIHQIEAAAQQDIQSQEYQQVLDFVFKKAYQLDDQTFQKLRFVREWDRRSKEIERPIPENPKDLIPISGRVEVIQPEKQIISLWFDGIQGGYTIPIVDSMPGWMLRPGAAFDAEVSYPMLQKGDWEKLQWRNIRSKEYTYLTEEELIQRITMELSSE